MTHVAGRHSEHYRVRDEELLVGLRRELLGPAQDAEQEDRDEVLTQDAPIDRYLTGVLYPRATKERKQEEAAEQDGPDDTPLTTRGDGEDSGTSPEVGASGDRRPSTMGLTFAVKPAISDTIVVSARAAVYEPTDADGKRIPARRAEARTTADQREQWRRRELSFPDRRFVVTEAAPKEPIKLTDEASLHVNIRRVDPTTGTVTITVTLINTQKIGEWDLQDAFSLFQCGLTIRAADGSTAFVERPAPAGAHDPEIATSRLLHRHAPTFAVGHGCAAEWDWKPSPVGVTDTAPEIAVAEVRSQFVPTVEVLLTDSNPEIDSSALSMLGLAERSDAEILTALEALADGYGLWIARKAAETEELAGGPHEKAALEQVRACLEALDRIRQGIELLRTKPDLMKAFRLANRAMADQRARSAWVKGGRVGFPDPAAGRWRPFQIAFVLLCLAGIDDPQHVDRGTADLLWFPTGGGKTEAYLGLIALTSFLRRIRKGRAGGGVTVLMRYTLRLLTLQQFERAAILLCAMEHMRRRTPELGHEEFSVGMWVGRSATPNTLAEADLKLTELRANLDKRLATENPVQLHACPWCGTRLDARDYEADEDAKRMYVGCPGAGCDFADGLPVHLIDEAVYDARPTLVIATVDKFASMPWRPATAALFNRDDPDGDTPPPDLIVQDELHLISGPLGTLTGLYETAVDALAGRPKVIASTATIRRAADQGRNLFAREVRQFPPAGLDARDSWFAVETPREEKASRRYVGLLAPGTSQATLLIRAYATLLHRALHAETEDEVRDAYWSLVGYFNSLRLLSAAELQVHDDVVAYLEMLAEREGVKVRSIANYSELTSRIDASEIPTRLKGIEKRLPDEDTVDVLLATNMIAVGVDVDRLGLMAVMGQPQTTAEYIQATSRVGRAHPGLVAVMLNSSRSRDRSHYESFQHFHSALYREVESTSVTPFSARARDRGLHAVIVALVRIMVPAARPNNGAGRVASYEHVLRGNIKSVLLERVGEVTPEETEAVSQGFDEFVDWWCDEADNHSGLLFEPQRGSRAPSLLKAYDDESTDVEAWSTLWSLRDVDAESALFLEGSR
ncbi:helicase-related protein [Streptomyces sp. NBC_01635]|uniref:helicase-related protein n=1 Tax=Streptomyces sp. NBC_01635 TaxID=2975904 RepID=UPI0038686178|nr:helicase-related protein [Streptomyces sp. NBC_01635]